MTTSHTTSSETDVQRFRRLNRERQARLRAAKKAAREAETEEAQAAAATVEHNRQIDGLILSALLSKPDGDLMKTFLRAFPGIMAQVGRDITDAGFDPKTELVAAARRHKRNRNGEGNAPPTPAHSPVTRTIHSACSEERIADWTDDDHRFYLTDFDHCIVEDPRIGELVHVNDRDGDLGNDDPDPDDVGHIDDDDDDVPEGQS